MKIVSDYSRTTRLVNFVVNCYSFAKPVQQHSFIEFLVLNISDIIKTFSLIKHKIGANC